MLLSEKADPESGKTNCILTRIQCMLILFFVTLKQFPNGSEPKGPASKSRLTRIRVRADPEILDDVECYVHICHLPCMAHCTYINIISKAFIISKCLISVNYFFVMSIWVFNLGFVKS